jgi:acyl transferase domain-containing protein
MSTAHEQHENDIAIVGMAARLPGAADVRRFWRNLRAGVESVRALSDDELLQAGVRPETLQSPSSLRLH